MLIYACIRSFLQFIREFRLPIEQLLTRRGQSNSLKRVFLWQKWDIGGAAIMVLVLFSHIFRHWEASIISERMEPTILREFRFVLRLGSISSSPVLLTSVSPSTSAQTFCSVPGRLSLLCASSKYKVSVAEVCLLDLIN